MYYVCKHSFKLVLSLRIIKLTSPNLNYFLLAGLAATALSFLDYPSTAYVVTVAECTVCNMHTQLKSYSYGTCIDRLNMKFLFSYIIITYRTPKSLLILDMM